MDPIVSPNTLAETSSPDRHASSVSRGLTQRDEQRQQVDRKIHDLCLQAQRILGLFRSTDPQYPPGTNSDALLLELDNAISCSPPADVAGQEHRIRLSSLGCEAMVNLRDRLRLLHEERNSLAPISRLPNEILMFVFVFCVSRTEHDFKYDSRSVTLFPYTHAFANVCRFWRQLALNLPSVWTHVPRSSLQLTRTFLSRSRNFPLFLNSSLSYLATTDPEAQDLALSHLGRARMLDYNYFVVAGHEAILSSRAPLLTLCRLHAGLNKNGGRLPDNFLGRDSPHLRTLSLEGISFDWDLMRCASLFQNLRKLSLLQLRANSFPTAEQLVTALQKMPLLQDILIIAAHKEVLLPIEGCSVVVVLQRLTKLTLHAPVSHVCDLLDHIRVPSCTRVSLDLYHSESDLDNGPSLMAFLDRHCTFKGDGPPLRSISYRLYNEKEIEFWVHTDNDEFSESQLLILNLSLFDSRGLLTPVVRRLLLGGIGLVRMIVEGHWDYKMTEVEAMINLILTRCSSATTIELENITACEFAVQLLLGFTSSTSPDVTPVIPDLLPSLRRMYMNLHGHRSIPQFRVLLPRLLALRTGMELDIVGANRLKEEYVERLREIADRPELVKVSILEGSDYDPDCREFGGGGSHVGDGEEEWDESSDGGEEDSDAGSGSDGAAEGTLAEVLDA
ncbi:hypothetical protein PUNSTDRAFT_135246 [Punctularia strigosozonata HHB-11173 SS5]|uniref:uncharacterized protein n=1 Tax=Punctularia strigosozonata (strain HHB-11173) TaxID=741275 RepID=UPI0004418667|nr:uncharacterized protein PUNSTDRAFT_135246 [Punctularia strigosozonata HHB-11173 SS5]EIN07724.1 hypothetical protein PUNSTDRAFT_135246 [Punctularia strigosozonata HHB-11173 SS5]